MMSKRGDGERSKREIFTQLPLVNAIGDTAYAFSIVGILYTRPGITPNQVQVTVPGVCRNSASLRLSAT